MEDIDPYEIGQEIGTGAFAHVYLGKDRRTGQRVAIKKIRANLLGESNQQKIDTEIQIQMSMNNPYIMKFLDSRATNRNFYLMLEYCAIGDLEVVLTKNFELGFPEELAQLIFQQIAHAFVEMHSQQIVHRDIKLSNIMMNTELDAKVGDFGFAKLYRADEIFQSFAGTPLTMAPEILKNEKYTEKCDIWSLGVILFQMLYGKYPYKPQNNSLHALLTLIDQNRKEPPFVLGVKVSEEAKDLMRQMLQVDERQRIDFPKLMGHSWIEKKLDAEAIKNRYRQKFLNAIPKQQLHYDTELALCFGKQLHAFLEGELKEHFLKPLEQIFDYLLPVCGNNLPVLQFLRIIIQCVSDIAARGLVIRYPVRSTANKQTNKNYFLQAANQIEYQEAKLPWHPSGARLLQKFIEERGQLTGGVIVQQQSQQKFWQIDIPNQLYIAVMDLAQLILSSSKPQTSQQSIMLEQQNKAIQCMCDFLLNAGISIAESVQVDDIAGEEHIAQKIEDIDIYRAYCDEEQPLQQFQMQSFNRSSNRFYIQQEDAYQLKFSIQKYNCPALLSKETPNITYLKNLASIIMKL